MTFSSGEVLTAANLNALDINSLTVDAQTLVVDAANNRVGVGIVAPTSPLHVQKASDITPDGNSVGHIQISGAGYSGCFALDAAGMWMSQNSSSRSLIFATNETERMRVNGSGLVGIGTTTPAYDLEVHDTLTVSDGSADFRVWATAGAESFRVTTTVVRSATIAALTTASAANMWINSGNNTIYRSTSSGKYKTDIETLWDDQADKILDLRPVYFRSNPETSADDHPEWAHYGFIAEEVAEIDPRLVNFRENYDDDGFVLANDGVLEPEGVQYDRMIPALVNLVKRQGSQIADLTARIEALEA